MYNPQYATIKAIGDDGQSVMSSDPVSRLDYNDDENLSRSFNYLSSQFGTIYVYSALTRDERNHLDL